MRSSEAARGGAIAASVAGALAWLASSPCRRSPSPPTRPRRRAARRRPAQLRRGTRASSATRWALVIVVVIGIPALLVTLAYVRRPDGLARRDRPTDSAPRHGRLRTCRRAPWRARTAAHENIVLLAIPVKSVSICHEPQCLPNPHMPPPLPRTRPTGRRDAHRSRRRRVSLACTRTRSGRGARPAGSATTGSTTAATAATGWTTSSGSSRRPSRAPRRRRSRRSLAPCGSPPRRGSRAAAQTLTEIVGRAGPPRRPRRGRLAAGGPRSRPRRGVPPDPPRHRRRAGRDLGAPAGRPRPAGDRRRRAGDHRGTAAPARRRSLFDARPRVSPSRSTRGPGRTRPAPVLGMGTDELVVRIPGGEAPWGILVLAGRDGARTGRRHPARRCDRPHAGRARPRRQRDRAGHDPPAPERGPAARRDRPRLPARRRRRRPRPVRPRTGAVRRGPRGGRSCATPRAGSRRPAAPASPRSFLAIARELEGIAHRQPRHPAPPAGPAARPGRAALVQPDPRGRGPGGRRHACSRRRSSTATSSTASCTSPTTGRTAGARATSTAPRRSPATRRSPSAPRGRSGGWRRGPRSSSRSSGSARASRASPTCREIGHAIATELRQLIDYENARVYRVRDESLVPVAMQGSRRGLRGREHRAADRRGRRGHHGLGRPVPRPAAGRRHGQRPARGHDPRHASRTSTSRCCSRRWSTRACASASSSWSSSGCASSPRTTCGCSSSTRRSPPRRWPTPTRPQRLRQQSDALERQLRAQQALLRITESILTTLDQREVLDQITDRLGSLIQCDNIAIEVVERPTGLLVPLTARGVHAEEYLAPWEPGETGIATWVVEHNEAVLIEDEAADERVNHFRDTSHAGGQPDRRPPPRAERRGRRPDPRAARYASSRSTSRSSSSSSCSRRRSRSPCATRRPSRRPRCGHGRTTSPGCSTTGRSRTGSGEASRRATRSAS